MQFKGREYTLPPFLYATKKGQRSNIFALTQFQGSLIPPSPPFCILEDQNDQTYSTTCIIDCIARFPLYVTLSNMFDTLHHKIPTVCHYLSPLFTHYIYI